MRLDRDDHSSCRCRRLKRLREKRFRPQPLTPRLRIMSRTHSEDTATPPGRLGRYDKGSLALQHWSSFVGATLKAAVPILFVVWVWCSQFIADWDPSRVDSMDTGSLTAAVTIAGLAVTTFFVTAQLRVSGIARYGITELYRARELTPLLVAALICVFSFTAGMASGAADMRLLSAYLSGLGICTLLFLQLVFVHLSLMAVLYLDSVSMGRQFAKRVSVTDADEWGLLAIHAQTVDGQLSVQRIAIVSNRMNFGIRDPLMPFHELVVAARPKEYGQLIGVLLARVLREYAVEWTAQSPTPELWASIPAKGMRPTRFVRSAIKRDSRKTQSPSEPPGASKLRLSLFLLIIHYVRRIPVNKTILETPDKARRDETQYQICRFVESLVILPRDPKRPDEQADEAERRAVVGVSLYAILEISRDFEDVTTDGRPEAMDALAVLARDLFAVRGWGAEAEFAVDILAWITTRSNQLSDLASVEIRSTLVVPAGQDDLARRYDTAVALGKSFELPTLPLENPWLEWRARREALEESK